MLSQFLCIPEQSIQKSHRTCALGIDPIQMVVLQSQNLPANAFNI